MKIYLLFVLLLCCSLSSCYTYKPLLNTPPINQEMDNSLHNGAIKVYPEWKRKATSTPKLVSIAGGSTAVVGALALAVWTKVPIAPFVIIFTGGTVSASLSGDIQRKFEENESRVTKKFKLVDKEIWVKKYNRTNDKEYVIVGEDIDEKTDKPYLILVPSIRKDRYLLEENRRRESRNSRD